jgi:hypothetical protein
MLISHAPRKPHMFVIVNHVLVVNFRLAFFCLDLHLLRIEIHIFFFLFLFHLNSIQFVLSFCNAEILYQFCFPTLTRYQVAFLGSIKKLIMNSISHVALTFRIRIPHSP